MSCPYGDSCKFNHDLAGYLAQKPPDLRGDCPYLDCTKPCPYGLGCRFASTHTTTDVLESMGGQKLLFAPNELNNLSKEFQRLLWKNTITFPKADAQLEAMGLLGKAKKMRKAGKIGDSGELGINAISKEAVDIEYKVADFKEHEDSSEIPDDISIVSNPGNPRHIPKLTEQEEHTLILPQGTRVKLPPNKRPKTGSPEISLEVQDLPVDTLADRKSVKEDAVCPLNIACQMDTKIGCEEEGDYVETKLGHREKKLIDFRGKLYLAPLTTVGNLPFRTVCRSLGADITCGEMAMCTNLLQGQASEWALLRRHSCEKLFGVQICGSFPDTVARTAELIEQECTVDFIDINSGCPIDLVVNKGAGSCLLTKPTRLEQIVRATSAILEKSLTIKVRMGYYEGRNCAHSLVSNMSGWGLNAVTVHGRTRQQRYSKMADWSYIEQCGAASKDGLQVIGNGDVFSFTDWTDHLESSGSSISTCMIARGALIKPWVFTEIKERRHWDITSGERLEILRQYVHAGLGHWGSDSKGVETTRYFLLEWLSYMHRYIPVGVLEVLPQRLNWRPPSYFGRDDLESLMASESAADWVRITEMFLGPAPRNFIFTPKHKSNAYDRAENG